MLADHVTSTDNSLRISIFLPPPPSVVPVPKDDRLAIEVRGDLAAILALGAKAGTRPGAAPAGRKSRSRGCGRSPARPARPGPRARLPGQRPVSRAP